MVFGSYVDVLVVNTVERLAGILSILFHVTLEDGGVHADIIYPSTPYYRQLQRS